MRQRDCIKYNFRNKNVHLLIYINNFEYLLTMLVLNHYLHVTRLLTALPYYLGNAVNSLL